MTFQSTPSQRGRHELDALKRSFAVFQSTPSQRGRLYFDCITHLNGRFQSTPSQRGRRDVINMPKYKYIISIHALAKRATGKLSVYQGGTKFQSTPSQRGRLFSTRVSCASYCYFNPRPRKEGDEGNFCKGKNIHYFNPRPRKEGD